MRFILIIFIFSFTFLNLYITDVLADLIEVSSPDWNETRSLQLRQGEQADLTVYLQSSGDMVGDYRVIVVQKEDFKMVQTFRTDKHGKVVFKNLIPGDYLVLLRKTDSQKEIGPTVGFGDMRLSVSEK
jgi:hypothetical protein